MWNLQIAILCLGLIYIGDTNCNQSDTIQVILKCLERGLDFMDKYYNQFNLDGLLGLIIAESKLLKIKPSDPLMDYRLKELLSLCDVISKKIFPLLPKIPKKFPLFEDILLKPQFWSTNDSFHHNLPNLGIYNWSKEYLLADKEAVYNGIHSDVCVQELLEGSINRTCKIGAGCKEMMFGCRIDRGYLLTHRLFYVQIGIRIGCFAKNTWAESLIKNYCALMLKEAKTNEHLEFPQRDIFLEQMVLCGIEGTADFLTKPWLQRLINWQTSKGCYSNGTAKDFTRSTNVIQFGCTDHTTGLGIAALALHLHYLLLM